VQQEQGAGACFTNVQRGGGGWGLALEKTLSRSPRFGNRFSVSGHQRQLQIGKIAA
jgi:hypothetical protein